MCSNSFRPSVHRFTHHLCVNDSQSELFTQDLSEPRPAFRLILDTGASVSSWLGIVSKSLLIFSLNPLLF